MIAGSIDGKISLFNIIDSATLTHVKFKKNSITEIQLVSIWLSVKWQ